MKIVWSNLAKCMRQFGWEFNLILTHHTDYTPFLVYSLSQMNLRTPGAGLSKLSRKSVGQNDYIRYAVGF